MEGHDIRGAAWATASGRDRCVRKARSEQTFARSGDCRMRVFHAAIFNHTTRGNGSFFRLRSYLAVFQLRSHSFPTVTYTTMAFCSASDERPLCVRWVAVTLGSLCGVQLCLVIFAAFRVLCLGFRFGTALRI